jgi:hypothetical protein
MPKGTPELVNLRLLQALSGGKGGATLDHGRDAFAGASPDHPNDEDHRA